jgi:ABC-type bacteriocin/lantibiotic exporter with double-glycine peptidase domain
VRRGRWIPVLLLIAWFPYLDACSMRLTSMNDFPEAVRLHDVAPYDQDPNLCGPYALAAVLNYMGEKADPAEIASRIHSPGAGGTLTMDLYLEARRRGVAVQQTNGTLQWLYEEMETGRPVIVLLKYPGLGRTQGHFVVVSGYSLDPEGLFLLWGDGRLSWMTGNRFLGLWTGSGFWSLSFPGEAGR